MSGLRLSRAEAERLSRRGRGAPVEKGAREPSVHERALAAQLDAEKIPYETEVQILSHRRYRYDFVLREMRIAIEVQGTLRGVQGGHQSEEGLTRDAEKAWLATLRGWTVLAVTPTMLADGRAIQYITRLLDNWGDD